MKSIMMAVALIANASTIKAQTNSDRISVGVGALYEQGFDMTLSYEHETKYHNAWEYFANGYMVSVLPISHACPEDVTIMATYVLELQQEVTPRIS